MGTTGEKRAMPGDPSDSAGQEDNGDGKNNNKTLLNGEKRPFLRKGTGLSRFYGDKPPKRYLKLRKSSSRKSESEQDDVGNKSENIVLEPGELQENQLEESTVQKVGMNEDEDDELRLFEEMEKAADAGSFCSSSSLAAHFLRTKLLAGRERTVLSKNGEDEDVYSPPSSLFDSEDDDNDDDEEDDDEEPGFIAAPFVVNTNSHTSANNFSEKTEPAVARYSFTSSNNSQRFEQTIVPKATSVPPLPLSTNRSHDIRILEEENTCLKARVVYLEEKMEKNTLEWWSFKEKMVNIIQGLQNSISRRDSQLENMQVALTKKIDALTDDIRSRGQKWGESHVEMVEKAQLLEEELHLLNDKLGSTKTKVLQRVDEVEAELKKTSLELSTNQDNLERRLSAMERKGGRRSASQSKESATSPLVCLKESVDDSVFGKNDDEDEEEGVTKILPNGEKETVYPNGTRKVIAHDLSEMRHLYTNGDVRITKRDGTVKYFYVDSGTWHTTYTNGVEYFEFANGQVERRNPNGVVEVVFTNGCVKYSHPTGTEECIFADNTILRVEPTGERSVVLPNGQKEVYRPDYKKRVYPDGTTKIVYSDGTQETRYPNGRVRIKRGDGALIADVVESKSKTKPGKQSPFQTT